jgi:hypothetical protein
MINAFGFLTEGVDRLTRRSHYWSMMTLRGRKVCIVCLTGAIVSLPILAGFAVAQSYPVTGKWTYENTGGEGPAPECGKRTMEFAGERRFDKGGGVPDYRNLSASRSGDEYKMVDEFNTGQIRARVEYNIRRIDNDHIEMKTRQGQTIPLRRCQ